MGLRRADPIEDADAWAEVHAELLIRIADVWLNGDGWPKVERLGREALRRGDATDVFTVLREVPAPLGRVEHDDTTRLRVRGLAYAPRAKEVLDDFVRAVELAAKRLRSDDPAPTLTRADLAEALGMSEERVRLVGDLILDESWMFSGGVAGAGSWSRIISEHTRHVLNVHSVADYLAVERKLWPPQRRGPLVLAAPPATAPTHASGQLDLHPAIAVKALPLLADGHTDAAVRAGALGLRDLLRSVTGFHEDGQALAGRAFGGPEPPVALTDISRRDGRSEQDGWRQLAQGVFAALRNPLAHRDLNLSETEAWEALATMSLVARRVAAAAGEVVSPNPE